MSLITDVDYFRHRLRLAYLRHADDSYAQRIVSFPSHYEDNLYIRTSGLADVERWPELGLSSSPPIEPHEEPSGFGARGGSEPANSWSPGGATGLKYTQTIMGNRSGIAGMRVTGRRVSKGSQFSGAPLNNAVTVRVDDNSDGDDEKDSDDALMKAATPAPGTSFAVGLMPGVPDLDLSRRRSSGGSTVIGEVIENTTTTEEDTPKPPRYEPAPTPAAAASNNGEVVETLAPLPADFKLPKFARGAEMEARRRRRMQMRMPAKVASVVEERQEAPRPLVLVDDTSSDESAPPTVEGSMTESDADEAAEMPSDFEPVSFLRPGYRQRNTSNGSDGASLLSAQLGLSVSQASVNSSLQAPLSERARARLSPVAEVSKIVPGHPAVTGLHPGQQSAHPRRPSRTHSKAGSGDISAVPGATATSIGGHLQPGNTTTEGSSSRPPVEPLQLRKTSSSRPPPAASSSSTAFPTSASGTAPLTLHPKPSVPLFRKKKPPQRAQSSALTARLMARSESTTNPFHYLYAAISGREDSHYVLRVYFPHSTTYRTTPREIRVRKDVSVEEVIGHALWVYWEDKAEPALDDESTFGGVDKKVRLSSAGWCLRIVEEDTDGEVDEDYPVIGRGGPIASWLKHDLAVCEASDTQIKQNLDLDSTIVRRASRLMKSSSASDALAASSDPTITHATVNANAVRRRAEGTGYSDDEILPPPVMHQTGTGIKVLLRVKWEDFADAVHLWTTLGVTMDMYMADVLEMACRKRRQLTESSDWALLTEDKRILVPLDRTVACLGGATQVNLIIMKRTLLGTLDGQGAPRKPGRSENPNASIFDTITQDSAVQQEGPTLTTYKRFTVRRKVPMGFGSHERVLAMDGDYIYIIPSATKALLDSPKTNSFHIKTVRECSQPKKESSTVRLVIQRDEVTKKRYDFEADSRGSAAEIVSIIEAMQKAHNEYNERLQKRATAVYRAKSTRRPRSSAGGATGAD